MRITQMIIMDEGRALRRLTRSKWRLATGLCFIALSSTFVVVGYSTGYTIVADAGFVFISLGLLYAIIGIYGVLKSHTQLYQTVPNFLIPSEVWKENPSRPDYWFFLGKEYLKQKQVKDAIDAFNRALELESTFPSAWFGLSQAWGLLSNYGQVFETAKEGLKIDPLCIDGLLFFADACFHMGDYQSALNALRACLKINKNHFLARKLLELWKKKEST